MFLARGVVAPDVRLLTVALPTVALLVSSCAQKNDDCGVCTSDSDCASGSYCAAFSKDERLCASYASGGHTECCSGNVCEIVYGTGKPSHSCRGAVGDSCESCSKLMSCELCGGCARMAEGDGICSGSCSACENQAGRTCADCAGCSKMAAKSCTGTSYSCVVFSLVRSSCEAAGCTWNDTSPKCSGTPLPCDAITDENQCRLATGCSWSDCIGSLGLCQDTPNMNDCLKKPECGWKPSCQGKLVTCDKLTSPDTCAAQAGCWWG